jgi:HK97 family phage portal protein
VIRANTLVQLPLVTYRLLEDGQERARTHYLYNLLRRRVNSQMSAFRFKQLLEMWICIYGNAYAWLDINDRGQTVAIYPWHPSRVSVELEDFAGEKQVPFYYFRHDSGEKTRAHWSQMIHLRGPGTDGFFGLNPISTHCQTLGYGLAMREHGSRFFSNGASIRGLIRPKDGVTIDPKRLDEAKKNWHDAQGGLSNAHKTAFLNAALEFQPIAMSMKEADYVAIADMNGPQICRIMNVPPPKVAILGRATYANITPMDTGRASAIFSTQRQVSAALGVATLGTVLLTRVHAANAGVTDPAALARGALTGYRTAFLVGTVFVALASMSGLLIHDEDAAATMLSRAEP